MTSKLINLYHILNSAQPTKRLLEIKKQLDRGSCFVLQAMFGVL